MPPPLKVKTLKTLGTPTAHAEELEKEAKMGAAQLKEAALAELRADRVVHLEVKGGEGALDEQRHVRPMVRVAVVVAGFAPRLPAVDAPQRIVDGAVGEEVAGAFVWLFGCTHITREAKI